MIANQSLSIVEVYARQVERKVAPLNLPAQEQLCILTLEQLKPVNI